MNFQSKDLNILRPKPPTTKKRKELVGDFGHWIFCNGYFIGDFCHWRFTLDIYD